MSERILGYILLTIGLGIILFSAYSVYAVFTGRKEPVKLFQFTGISLDLGQFVPSDLPKQSQTQLPEAPKVPLIPKEMINQPINLAAHLLLMGFISTIGFKIASLGVMLLRPIVVHSRKLPLVEQNSPKKD